MVIEFSYTDNDLWGPGEVAELVLDFTKDPVEMKTFTGPSGIEATISMSMEQTIAHLFWMQRLNTMAAITGSLIKVKGPLPKAMKLLPALKPVHANYKQVLKDSGRDDLLRFPPD